MASVLASLSPRPKAYNQLAQLKSDDCSQSQNEAFADELDMPQPSFSIAIDNDIDPADAFYAAPSRLSIPLEDEQNGRSVEIVKGAASERPAEKF